MEKVKKCGFYCGTMGQNLKKIYAKMADFVLRISLTRMTFNGKKKPIYYAILDSENVSTICFLILGTIVNNKSMA